MDQDINTIATNFRLFSARVFQSFYNDFRIRVKKLDRLTDENVFQSLQGRYIKELEKQLTQSAEKMINEYKGQDTVNKLQKELTEQILYYLSEFRMKARSM